MSTKATRELAEAVRDGVPVVASMAVDALAEIGAIEKAAEALLSEDTESADTSVCEPAMRRYLEAMELMDVIAKEANARRPQNRRDAERRPMKRHGKTRDSLSVAVEVAKSGARVVVVCTKATAKRTHAELAVMEGGTRAGDSWTFGKGSIEVRT